MDGIRVKSLSKSTSTSHHSAIYPHPFQHTHVSPGYTISTPISCCGIGLHSGQYIHLKLLPAPAGTGILFRRTDLNNAPILARYDHVIDTTLSTVIACPNNPQIKIATIEHLMSALAGNQIDNIIIECDGPELPVLDGSAAKFDQLLQTAGRQTLLSIASTIKILEPVRVEYKDAFAELRPSVYKGLSLSLSIDFPASIIGQQQFSMQLTPQNFKKELANCRTFAFKDEIDSLHKMGLAKGGSLDNAIVVENNSILNPSGLRRRDEFVRHKMLDAIGDLSLVNSRIQGHFIGHKSGHTLNNMLLRKLMAKTECWRYISRKTKSFDSITMIPNLQKQEA
ncbi:UDP-3-O-acyl-N-acetylglucosamine deacetylase [Commensalibacter oyaizuii]|uniref:UDP-3-O-acyl-N-acetylglucosamine deacetylase n=1 Tax=Commensalibacter oyaizuii TaxID=3043873 RepID=A0ABT6Q1B0_9PROT|nr:UDP-3-O-acyl-N-acetylglucosamine deacetylase [Commensalibacter sp. TBRC 16381]MDI2090768.1 UDP-3-O-acyl-N-acetylglucosamine deacetylase [Commensalibacter sp. TBRC 16381]